MYHFANAKLWIARHWVKMRKNTEEMRGLLGVFQRSSATFQDSSSLAPQRIWRAQVSLGITTIMMNWYSSMCGWLFFCGFQVSKKGLWVGTKKAEIPQYAFFQTDTANSVLKHRAGANFTRREKR